MSLKRICPICKGAGTDIYCRYTGLKYYGNVEDMLGLFLSHEILEATDQDEYGALSGTKKNAYDMILKCGMVDLNEGTQVRASLWDMFGEGTTTRANLEALTSFIEVPEGSES